MVEYKESEEEKRLKHIFHVHSKICAILIIVCGITAIALTIASMFMDSLPEIFILIVGVLFVACLISHALMKGAQAKYFKELWKQNDET